MSKDSKKAKAHVMEVLGSVTGDRPVEAEGRVEAKVADPVVPLKEKTGEVIDREEDAVRQRHDI